MNKVELLTTIAAISIVAPMAVNAEPMTLDMEFVDHLRMEMIEQDVYVERTAGSGEIFRVTVDEREQYLDAPVFGTAGPVHHDPVNMEANGPHTKGAPLGFTLGQWLAGTGKGSYRCEDNKASFAATFENLVPDGVYTFWSFYLPTPFPEPFGTYDLPMGARNGSESVFTADAKGYAAYNVTFEPCLQMTGSQLMAGMAIAYHSDGQTYGGTPGEFGNKTHVQLFTLLPKDEEIAVASR